MGTKSVCLMTSCLKPYCSMAPRLSNVVLKMGKHSKFKWIDEIIVCSLYNPITITFGCDKFGKKIY